MNKFYVNKFNLFLYQPINGYVKRPYVVEDIKSLMYLSKSKSVA